jgi:osmoprotectant transport system permease protein
VREQLALLPAYLTAHLELTLVALGVGTLVSVPLGILVTRRRALEGPVLGLASAVQTIPSLALLAVMVPALAALGALSARLFGLELRSIGYLPAILALTLYGMLPILRNTVAGIEGVDPALREAAAGVGMTDRESLRRVELPLALPVIVAGIRTASVWIVGTATLSTPVGATSLGNYIFSGLQTRNLAAVGVGCAAAAALAIALDQTIRGIETGIRERRRGLRLLSVSVLAGICAATAAGAAYTGRAAGGSPVQIGAKTFTEQYVLAEILARWLERETSLPSSTRASLGSTVAFDALAAGEIDVYVEYAGTIWATLMKRDGAPPPRDEVRAEVEAWLRSRGLTVVCALGFENAYALGMRAEDASRLGVARIGDLARLAPQLEIGGDFEFFTRAEWRALERVYGLAFRAQRTMDPSLMFPALAAGQVDVISAYSTDGRLAAQRVVLLDDERGVIPPYDALLLASARFARERPAAVAALAKLGGAIDRAAMQRMNDAVDAGGESPAAVARRFVEARAR